MSIYPWQTRQWKNLLAVRANNRMPHAIMLSGAGGTGLQQFAISLAARILCGVAKEDELACGTCNACILFNAGNHPDILKIEPEEEGRQIKVDGIRELVDYVNMRSQYGRHKLAIIHPAEAMNRYASNSLLKTLEEPPAASIIILLTEQPALLPITIRSRCQRINFPAVYDEAAMGWLRDNLVSDQYTAEELLYLAGGGPLQALELAESGAIARQLEVLEDLGDIRRQAADPVITARKWLKMEDDVSTLLKQLLALFSGMCRIKLGNTGNNSLVHRHLHGIVKGLDLVQIVRCHDALFKLYRDLQGPYNLNKQGLLEDFIVFWRSTVKTNGG